MTAALDAIARLDFGQPLPGDAEIAAVFDRHSSDDWFRFEQHLAAVEAHPTCGADCDVHDGGEGGSYR